MCDIGGSEADVCNTSRPRARRNYRCSECGLIVTAGQQHTKTSMLYEGSWHTFRTHEDCHSLLEYIAYTVCGQNLLYIACEPLRDRVREHMREAPEVLRRYRDVLRARRTEGVWPARRAA